MEVSRSSIASRRLGGYLGRPLSYLGRPLRIGSGFVVRALAGEGIPRRQKPGLPTGGSWAETNFQGGSWTRDQYGGAKEGTGVCLDICGWNGGCFGCSARRRTDSNPSIFKRSILASFFAPRGFGAVGGTHSASRRSRFLSGCACDRFPFSAKIGSDGDRARRSSRSTVRLTQLGWGP